MSEKNDLIKLAAEMLMDTGVSTHIEEYTHKPANIPVRWWREICDQIFIHNDKKRMWAIRVREIADRLST